MKVSRAMTRNVRMIRPDDTICDAAKLMAECDCGALPVTDGDRLIGMITDRDLALRAIAHNRGPQTRVADVMTPSVKYCFDDQDTEEVAENMAEIQIRRLPVVDHGKNLVGILALGDLALKDKRCSSEALSGISQHAA